MYVCMYVCIYVCTVCMYVCMYVWMNEWMNEWYVKVVFMSSTVAENVQLKGTKKIIHREYRNHYVTDEGMYW